MTEFAQELARLAEHYGKLPQKAPSRTEYLPWRFWAKVNKTDTCWTWTASTNRGYGVIGTAIGVESAHRVSWIMAFGAIPEGMHVLHHCDNPICVRPDHLFLGTNADNVADRIKKGRRGGRPVGTGDGHHRHCRCHEQLIADNLRLRALAEGLMNAS